MIPVQYYAEGTAGRRYFQFPIKLIMPRAVHVSSYRSNTFNLRRDPGLVSRQGCCVATTFDLFNSRHHRLRYRGHGIPAGVHARF